MFLTIFMQQSHSTDQEATDPVPNHTAVPNYYTYIYKVTSEEIWATVPQRDLNAARAVLNVCFRI